MQAWLQRTSATARRLFLSSEAEPDADRDLKVVSESAATREPRARSAQARDDITNIDAQAERNLHSASARSREADRAREVPG
jgi:hypothetical protein